MTHDTEVTLPADAWSTVRSFFGDALELMRLIPPFAKLGPGEWSVLVAATNGMRHGAACPLDALASAAGISRASAYRHLTPLRAQGILAPVSTPAGQAYGIGPTLGGFLETFARDRAPATWRTSLTSRRIPGAARQSQIETSSESEAPLSLNKIRSINSSSSEKITERVKSLRARERAESWPVAHGTASSAAPTLPRDALPEVGGSSTRAIPLSNAPRAHSVPRQRLEVATLRAAAIRALTAHHRIAHPGHSPPAVFPTRDIELVVAASALHEWTVAEIDQAHQDAIHGGVMRARKQPPTPYFIWGDGYFLANVGAGREQRLAKDTKPEASKIDASMNEWRKKIAVEKAEAAPPEEVARILAEWRAKDEARDPSS